MTVNTETRCPCGQVVTIKSSNEGTHFFADENGSEHVCAPAPSFRICGVHGLNFQVHCDTCRMANAMPPITGDRE